MTSSPTVLLARLTDLGATVSVNGDRLHIEAPAALPDNLLAALRERKAEILPLARLVSMPLDVFAREGQPVEVRVAWWPETLWFVPDVRYAEALWREGIERERVWTAAELLVLLEATPPLTTEALRVVMVARREFAGEVVEVRPRREAPETR